MRSGYRKAFTTQTQSKKTRTYWFDAFLCVSVVHPNEYDFSPRPIQQSVLNRFSDMLDGDFFTAFDIGNCS